MTDSKRRSWVEHIVRAFAVLLVMVVAGSSVSAQAQTPSTKADDLKTIGSSRGEHDSVGKPAPQATLKSLGGDEFTLASLRGKVVLLDFWATWCGPCVISLPNVTQVAEGFADRDLVFYAVNLREPKERIKKFLGEKGIKPPVATDRWGKVGQSFGVRGIPHSALIDKKGVVRHVHIGFLPGMEKTLKKEIEVLLAE